MRSKNARRIVTAAVVGAIALSSCGPAHNGGNDVERAAPDSAHTGDLAAGLNDAGYQLFHVAAEQNPNTVLSPLSIGIAFGMVDVGATGVVADALQELFAYPIDGEDRWQAFNTLEQTLVRERQEGDDATGEQSSPTLTLANRAFFDKEFDAVDGYNELLQTWFGSDIETLPLQSDHDGSRDHINAWVSERTQELIPQLLPKGFINNDSVLVLVNALYMKAEWREPFEEVITEDGPFTLLDGSSVSVPMMRDTKYQSAAHVGERFAAIDLPYANSDLSMLVIVPDAGAYLDVESRLNSEFVSDIDTALTYQSVYLEMPRFESEDSLSLKYAMEDRLGIEGIFEVKDLKGISEEAWIDAAVHAAKIIVDETGTEAAAATAVGVTAMGIPEPPNLELIIDRPFLYVIRDHQTGAVLFVGRVLDPTF